MRLAPNSIIRAEMKCAVVVMIIHIIGMKAQNIMKRCRYARSEFDCVFHSDENKPKTCSYFFPMCARAIDKTKG